MCSFITSKNKGIRREINAIKNHRLTNQWHFVVQRQDRNNINLLLTLSFPLHVVCMSTNQSQFNIQLEFAIQSHHCSSFAVNVAELDMHSWNFTKHGV